MKKLLVAATAVFALFQLSACNTVRGVGEDIKKGGEAIEKAAR
ncbi:entericidin A/B family lipoprotein [Chitinimonas sp.]